MADNGCLDSPKKSTLKIPLLVFFRDARLVFKLDSIGREILGIAFPAALAVAADPIASLIDTAFIGHIGPLELAAAGVSIALFNQASRITIFPLVSITTSFVAEEDTIRRVTNTKLGEENLNHDDKGDDDDDDDNDSDKTKEEEASLPLDEAEHDTLQDLEKGPSIDDNTESSRKSSSGNNELKEPNNLPKRSSAHNNQEDTNTNASKFFCAAKSNNSKEKKGRKKKRNIASASTALLFGTILGLLQAAVLIFAAKPLLLVMGAKRDSQMLILAEKYLKLRSLGAPAVLLALAMQGIFRGFKDTKTPLYVIVAGYAVNVALDPILIFYCKLGLKGAAIAHVVSQYLMAVALFLILMKKVNLLPPSLKDLQIFRFLRNGGLLLAKVLAVTFCVTLAASLASRLGPIPMAAFQTCLQVWLTSSLLADGLAVAIQAILACSFAEKDLGKATAAATRVLQMTFVMGVALSIVVGIGLYFGAGVFSKNASVLQLIRIGIPFVAATQPINSLAFAFDGVNYGASDFAYAAYSLVMVSAVSIGIEFVLYRAKGFIGIWIALTIYMTLRMLAGIWRMGTGTGPWGFLRNSTS